MSLDSFHRIDRITLQAIIKFTMYRVKVNLHGKVDEYLCNGAGDSVAALVAALAHHVGGT
jgi:hypothetical protein